MPHYLDISQWARRDLFEFFREYDNPYFNICTRLDITKLKPTVAQVPGATIFLGYQYIALRLVNEIESFRYRLEDGKVRVYDVIHGGTTVLMENGSFTFAYFDYDVRFSKFVIGALEELAKVKNGDGRLHPKQQDNARIHSTTLPWISFTSFTNARKWRQEDSIPKFAFGRFVNEGDRVLLPISIEVHHALMDGYHVGQYLNRFEEILEDPASVLLEG